MNVDFKLRDWNYLEGYEIRVCSPSNDSEYMLLALTEPFLGFNMVVGKLCWFNGILFKVDFSKTERKIPKGNIDECVESVINELMLNMNKEHEAVNENFIFDFEAFDIKAFVKGVILDFIALYPLLFTIEV